MYTGADVPVCLYLREHGCSLHVARNQRTVWTGETVDSTLLWWTAEEDPCWDATRRLHIWPWSHKVIIKDETSNRCAYLLTRLLNFEARYFYKHAFLFVSVESQTPFSSLKPNNTFGFELYVLIELRNIKQNSWFHYVDISYNSNTFFTVWIAGSSWASDIIHFCYIIFEFVFLFGVCCWECDINDFILFFCDINLS